MTGDLHQQGIHTVTNIHHLVSTATATKRSATAPAAPDPHALLDRIIAESPRAGAAAWRAAFLEAIAHDERLLLATARAWCDRALMNRSASAAKRRNEADRAAAAAAAEQATQVRAALADHIEQAATIVLLNLMMPNGRTLGDSTGADCKRFGGWFEALAERVPEKRTVASTLSEVQVRRIWANANDDR